MSTKLVNLVLDVTLPPWVWESSTEDNLGLSMASAMMSGGHWVDEDLLNRHDQILGGLYDQQTTGSASNGCDRIVVGKGRWLQFFEDGPSGSCPEPRGAQMRPIRFQKSRLLSTTRSPLKLWSVPLASKGDASRLPKSGVAN